MQKYKDRLPLLSLQNQYTYLRNNSKKNNKLYDFSLQLSNVRETKKLPSIDKKYIKTARKVQKQLNQIQKLLQNRKKLKNPISQHRYLNHNIAPLYIPIPMHMQMSAFLPHTCAQQNLQPLQTNSQLPLKISTANQELQKEINNNSKIEAKPGDQNKKIQVNKNIKQIVKFPEKSRINRFRVVAYAVYFAIYFKYYSKKFTQIRRNWFNQRYAINEGKIIFESSSKILKHLYEIDIFKMITIARQRAKQYDFEQYRNAKGLKAPDQILTLIHFVTLLIQYVNEYMTGHAFIQEHHEVFTVGLLNQNFMINNLYLPQEAALLHIHPKGYIKIEEETQIILLMLKIIVKILIFNYLLSLRHSRQWNAKQQKSHSLDDKDLGDIWNMTRMAAVFLCITCQQIYDKTHKQITNPAFSLNFNEMSPKFNIFAAKSLQQVKKPNISNQNQKQKYLQCKFILNLQGYAEMKSIISANLVLSKFKQKIKMKIIDLLTVIYTSLKYEEAKVYDFISKMTFQEKFLVLKGRQIEKDMKQKLKKKRRKNGKQKDKRKKNGQNKNGVSFQDGDSQNLSQNNQYDQNNNRKKDQQQDQSENSQDSELDPNSKQDRERKAKRKKLRFKYQQAFYDHKFLGHNKLLKLKQKVTKK